MSEFETIRTERPESREHVARLIIDRPEQLNTITATVLTELPEAITALEEDTGVRAVVLEGAGDRAFSAGANVQAFAESASPLDGRARSRQGQTSFARLEESPLPVVAAIDGYALGGGMELAACADLRVASADTELAQPEVNLGLIPGWGGTQRLARIVGEGRAKEILLTGERYDASTLAEYGFINEVVETNRLTERALELTAQLAGGPPVANESIKRAVVAGRSDPQAGFEVEAQAFGHLFGTDDMREGITAFLNDEEPTFNGR